MSWDTIKDLTAGTAGGIAQVLVGQPFDICKVRMQTAPAGTYTGLIQCATDILKNEGPFAFYKGTMSPLVGIGACVSIQFGVLEACKRHFTSLNPPSSPNTSSLTSSQLLTAGALAGIANSVVSGPVEHIRIRMQVQSSDISTRLYSSTGDALKTIVRKHGVSGLYKGQVPTLWRESIGYGVYFLTYEKLVQRDILQQHQKGNAAYARKDVSSVKAVLFGATAGYVLWAFIYPIDVIKSRIQTDGFGGEGSKRRYGGMVDCARTVWRSEGMAGFLRGLGPTVIRSPFANGATFLGFELASRALNNL